MSRRTYLFAEPPENEEHLGQIIDAIAGLLQRRKIYFHYAFSKEAFPNVIVHTWLGSRGDEELEVTDDTDLSLRYLVLNLDSETRMREVVEDLAQTLRFRSLRELQDDVRNNTDDAAALFRLGLGSNEYDADSAELVSIRLQHPAPTIRQNAAKAASLMGWPQLIAPLKSALLHETDEPTRRLLQYALKRCRTADTNRVSTNKP